MNELIKANFARLFRSKLFYFCMIFMSAIGIIAVYGRYMDLQKHAEYYKDILSINEFNSPDGFLFLSGIYGMFAIAVFTGIFIGTEYSDGTIRNKLMIGHSRGSIYLSNLIVCSASAVMMNLAFIIPVKLIGSIILEYKIFTVKEIIIFTLSGSLGLIAFTAIFLLISMIITSKAGGSVAILISVIVMFCATMTINNMLNAPEYYEAYSYIDEDTGETVTVPEEKNLSYPTGTKREIYEFLNNFIPSSQLYQIAMGNKNNLDVMALYSALIITVGTVSGIIIFRKKNLK